MSVDSAGKEFTMLTMIVLIAVAAFYLRLMGFGLRIFGRIIGWLIGMAIVISIIGGVFGVIGLLAGLAAHLLPVAVLVGIGIFIGRRIRGNGGMNGSFQTRARDAIDGCRERAQDVFGGYRNNVQQDVVDANGRVIR